jgi:hypothetical protein
MAQAQVVLTAVDRTQVAINSALKGMKTLERTAKVTARAVNLAFGLLSGTILVSAFGKITEAAKKTEEGRRALDDFNKALKDPALVSAANSFTTTIIKGFTEVVKFAAEAAKATTKLGRDLGLIAQPVDPSQFGKGEGGRRGRAPQVDPLNRMENEWKFRQQMTELQSKRDKEAAALSAKLLEGLRRDNDLTMTEIERTVMEFKEFSAAIDRQLKAGTISQSLAESRMSEYLDRILPEVEVTGKKTPVQEFKKATDQMQEFAKAAAESIQSSFADFLFDPFKNGLKGMLSGFLNVIRRMIAKAAAATILESLFGGYRGKGGWLGALADALIPAGNTRAMGGSVSAGTPYLVGERGPEMFVPGTSGNIVPNNKMGGVTVSPVYNIDARGASADLQDALPGILAENNRRIFDELDRRYGIGR